MKQQLGLTAIVLAIILAAVFVSMSARAGDRRSTFGGDQDPSTEAPAAAASVEPAAGQSADTDTRPDAIIDVEGDTDPDADKPKTAPPSEKEMYDALIAISPPGGVQLPTPADSDHSDWLIVKVGFASMLIPPGWEIQNQIGREGDEDQTIGVGPPSNEIYVELRQIQNSDSNYMQTPLDLAISDYRSKPDRLKDGITFGFQPMVIDGAVGHVETMNQFGKEKNEDGTPTFRLINWHGRWEQNDAIQSVELSATFAQDGYEKFAPVVSEILATIKTNNSDAAK